MMQKLESNGKLVFRWTLKDGVTYISCALLQREEVVGFQVAAGATISL
jgi:hypothetical protein